MNKSWLERIIVSLTNIADADQQKKAWTGQGPNVSSYIEEMCSLYDDSLFTQFVEKNREHLSAGQMNLIDALNKNIELLNDDKIYEMSASELIEFIDSKEWIQIQNIAIQLVKSFYNSNFSDTISNT
jgi:hypothetical protein